MTALGRRIAMMSLSLVAVVALSAGCAKSVEVQSAAMMSEVRPASELGGDPRPGAGGFDTGDLDLEGLDETFEDLFGEMGGLFDEVDDLLGSGSFDELFGDLLDELSPGDLGLDSFGDCFDLAVRYGQLMFGALGSNSAVTDSAADALRESLPRELHDDLDVVANALRGASFSDLINESGPLASSEFRRADDAITGWLEAECDAFAS